MSYNPYLKVVDSKQLMETFKSIWLDVCVEQTYESEDFHTKETGMHVLIKDENGEFAGTAEIGRYIKNETSTVQFYFDFSQIEEIAKDMENTYEVDKVCLTSENRGKGLLLNAFYVMLFHHFITDSSYYVAAIEWKFYRALRNYYHVPLIGYGKRQRYNDFYLQPMMVNIKEFVNQLKTNNPFDLNIEFIEKLAKEYKERTLNGGFISK
ncbi:hypothetical protein [Bacillus sp. USDA818B3_A]|uniref:hypothetical protein n=1 Tax=Bacillus sp. USDA818B3_A TaxID=2698834 RepID=UPI00136AF816|nr:hypothetical protein [Bacillus sp. USDA818B3_A]